MKKLTYTEEQQIVRHGAQMLLEKHLAWSGSHESIPSRDLGGVRGHLVTAYLKERYTVEEWDEASDEERRVAEEQADFLYTMAAQLADRKWEAAITLLSI